MMKILCSFLLLVSSLLKFAWNLVTSLVKFLYDQVSRKFPKVRKLEESVMSTIKKYEIDKKFNAVCGYLSKLLPSSKSTQ